MGSIEAYNDAVLRIAACVLVSGILLLSGSLPQPKKYVSPDGDVTAIVISVGKEPGQREYEGRVELRSKTGKLLAARDYSSEDGQHGYGVTRAQWTPNSQFFVYSLQNSGGHAPWHSPVNFYSRAENKILSLDDAVEDAVMDPQFEVSPPDRVTVTLWFSKKTLTISLAALMAKTKQ